MSKIGNFGVLGVLVALSLQLLKLLSEVQDSDIIFIGENHGDKIAHFLEFEILEGTLRKCGAEIVVVDSLKIDGDVEPEPEKTKDWRKELAEKL